MREYYNKEVADWGYDDGTRNEYFIQFKGFGFKIVRKWRILINTSNGYYVV